MNEIYIYLNRFLNKRLVYQQLVLLNFAKNEFFGV